MTFTEYLLDNISLDSGTAEAFVISISFICEKKSKGQFVVCYMTRVTLFNIVSVKMRVLVEGADTRSPDQCCR